MKKIIFFAVIISLILSLSFKILDDRDDFELVKNLEIYHNVLKQLHYNYVDKIDSRSLITTSIDKMLEQLDPYTVYFPESEIESIRIISEAQYTGIGITVDTFENQFFVTEVVKKSEADKSGIKMGDIITNVNGIETAGKSFDDVHNLISGQIGKKVNLNIQRQGENFEFSVVRQVVDISVVSLATKIDDIGYIKLENFSDKSYFEFKSAYLKLKKQKINGLIIDLRDNPGGLLDQAVNILNLFIPAEKVVVTSKGNSKNSNVTFMTKFSPDDLKIPIVVLVNNNSASASEIVAGTIQDYDRGVVIGENTFGKGLVQRIFNLGYNSKIKITVSKYYIPSGRCIQEIDYSHNNNNIDKSVKFYTANGRIVYEGNGIKPDIEIKTDTLDDIIKKFVDKHVIFNFSNFYFENSDTSKWSSPLLVNFDEINVFYEFILKNNSLRYLEEIKDISKLEAKTNINSDVYNQLEVLRSIYISNFKDIIFRNKEQIAILISQELVKHKFYHEGELIFNLKHDFEVQKGKSILMKKSDYNKILNP